MKPLGDNSWGKTKQTPFFGPDLCSVELTNRLIAKIQPTGLGSQGGLGPSAEPHSFGSVRNAPYNNISSTVHKVKFPQLVTVFQVGFCLQSLPPMSKDRTPASLLVNSYGSQDFQASQGGTRSPIPTVDPIKRKPFIRYLDPSFAWSVTPSPCP